MNTFNFYVSTLFALLASIYSCSMHAAHRAYPTDKALADTITLELHENKITAISNGIDAVANNAQQTFVQKTHALAQALQAIPQNAHVISAYIQPCSGNINEIQRNRCRTVAQIMQTKIDTVLRSLQQKLQQEAINNPQNEQEGLNSQVLQQALNSLDAIHNSYVRFASIFVAIDNQGTAHIYGYSSGTLAGRAQQKIMDEACSFVTTTVKAIKDVRAATAQKLDARQQFEQQKAEEKAEGEKNKRKRFATNPNALLDFYLPVTECLNNSKTIEQERKQRLENRTAQSLEADLEDLFLGFVEHFQYILKNQNEIQKVFINVNDLEKFCTQRGMQEHFNKCQDLLNAYTIMLYLPTENTSDTDLANPISYLQWYTRFFVQNNLDQEKKNQFNAYESTTEFLKKLIQKSGIQNVKTLAVYTNLSIRQALEFLQNLPQKIEWKQETEKLCDFCTLLQEILSNHKYRIEYCEGTLRNILANGSFGKYLKAYFDTIAYQVTVGNWSNGLALDALQKEESLLLLQTILVTIHGLLTLETHLDQKDKYLTPVLFGTEDTFGILDVIKKIVTEVITVSVTYKHKIKSELVPTIRDNIVPTLKSLSTILNVEYKE